MSRQPSKAIPAEARDSRDRRRGRLPRRLRTHGRWIQVAVSSCEHSKKSVTNRGFGPPQGSRDVHRTRGRVDLCGEVVTVRSCGRPPSLLVFAIVAAGCTQAGPPSGTTCNGHDELCARRYDEVTFAGTHDAYSNVAENFGAPDQTYDLTRQLDDGVRVLHLEMLAVRGRRLSLPLGVPDRSNAARRRADRDEEFVDAATAARW